MKTQGPPRITIPKGSLIDGQDPRTGFSYHYSRDERQSQSVICSDPPKSRGFRAWLSKNRGLAITLLDLFLLVILVVLFQTVLRPNLSAHNFKDLPLRIELNATRLGDQVAARIEILNKDENFIPPPEGARVSFFLLPSVTESLNRARIREVVLPMPPEDFLAQNSESIFGIPAVSAEFFYDLLPQGNQTMTYSALLPTWGAPVEYLWAFVSLPNGQHGVVVTQVAGN